jgi:hypothetical protein
LGPDAFQGAEHPDANLLAAFVEKTLTEKEHTQVLNHLSQCAECREVAAFTLPAEVTVAEAPRRAVWRRWNPWPVLRWGAMAAVLGALALIVVMHPAMWKQHPEISKEMPPPTPAGNMTSAPQPASAPLAAPPPPETARTKAQVHAQEYAGGPEVVGSAAGPHQDLGLNDYRVNPPARQQVSRMASSRPPVTLKAKNAPATNATREESGVSGLTAGALPAPPSPSASANESMASSDEAGKVTAESRGGLQAMRATSQSVAVGGGNSGAGAAQVTAVNAAPRAAARPTVQVAAQARMSEMAASRPVMKFVAGTPTALWSVSSDGKVQRSTDAGKTIELIPVAHGIRFQAIAASGNDVWAGGTDGALFHSIDAGTTWMRIAISFGGNTVTETIAAIQLHDPQHLSVTTASGLAWITEDGGQHWQKQP